MDKNVTVCDCSPEFALAADPTSASIYITIGSFTYRKNLPSARHLLKNLKEQDPERFKDYKVYQRVNAVREVPDDEDA